MDTEIKISVVMPVYNAEEYLKETIDSILAQTFREFELICVDDGSTDRSFDILKESQVNDPRIRIIRQKNQYAGAARNKGIEEARGKYIIFLDADDLFAGQMLEKAYNCAEKENADVVVWGGKYFCGNLSEAVHHDALLYQDKIPNSDSFSNNPCIEFICNFTTPAPWNKLFLLDYIRNSDIRFQTCKRFNDIFFVENALIHADRIGVVREDLVYYRTDNSTSLQHGIDETPLICIDVFREIKKRLERDCLYDEVKNSFRQLAISNFIYNLDSVKTGTAFDIIYNSLKTGVFEEFGIAGSQPEEYYYRYPYYQYEKVMRMTPVEYLIDRGKTGGGKAKEYLFPFGKVEPMTPIVIYGAGKVGGEYLKQINKTQYTDDFVIVDKAVKEIYGSPVISPDLISWERYQYIVIAVNSLSKAEEIKKTLINMYEIIPEKIIWGEDYNK